MNVLLLLDGGWTAERIAEALFIDAETVREHRRLYETAGITGLERLRAGPGRGGTQDALWQQAAIRRSRSVSLYQPA